MPPKPAIEVPASLISYIAEYMEEEIIRNYNVYEQTNGVNAITVIGMDVIEGWIENAVSAYNGGAR